MAGQWNSTAPDGTKSVKTNRPILQTNTTYIETNMQLDHFWNEDETKDGYHKKTSMVKQASDPAIPTGTDGVFYVKDTAEGRAEGFYRNSNGIYQHVPSVLTGTVNVNNNTSFINVVAVPANTYGEIFMNSSANNKFRGQRGFYISNGTTCQAWSYGLRIQGASSARYSLRFGNGDDASGLNFRVFAEDALSISVWTYIITYRDL